jgi:uncharacterized protein YbaR (Trm112 family)
MVSQDLIDLLRCPLDPAHARLELIDDRLVCTRCRLRFPVRQDIPCLLVEEAELPAGCSSVADLPCQRAPVADPTQSSATP